MLAKAGSEASLLFTALCRSLLLTLAVFAFACWFCWFMSGPMSGRFAGLLGLFGLFGFCMPGCPPMPWLPPIGCCALALAYANIMARANMTNIVCLFMVLSLFRPGYSIANGVCPNVCPNDEGRGGRRVFLSLV